MEERHKNDKEVLISLLNELKQLRDNGKKRSEEVVKSKEQQLRQRLQIPDEAWYSICSDVSFDEVINKLEKRLGEIFEMNIQRRKLSPSELIGSASGGLALRGILLTNNIESSTDIRKTVVDAPADIKLLAPIRAEREETVEFTSQQQSSDFNRSLDVLGYDTAFSGQACINKHHEKETISEEKTNKSELFYSREIIACVSTAICELNKNNLKLAESATKDLREIDTLIDTTNDTDLIRKKCDAFFESYGSHVNTGIIEFGGMFRWRATYIKEYTSKKRSDTNIVRDILDLFISMSYSGLGISTNGSASGRQINANSGTTLDYDETELSKLNLGIKKNGGPQEITSLPIWKIGLINDNETWAILRRGSNLDRDFVGIWKLIQYNSDSFKNSKKLSDTLQHIWHATYKIQPMPIPMDLNQNKKSRIILEQLKLINYYPSKISLRDVMAISDLPEKSIAALPWRIMQKLIMLDYIGRDNEIKKYAQLCTKTVDDDFSLESIFSDEECPTLTTSAVEDEYSFNSIFRDETSDISIYHPQDVFLAIISCCDLTLKQTITSKMFLCRLSVPFLSPPLTGDSLQLSLWALRSIIIEWKVNDAEYKDSSVIKEPIKTVSFIRLGKPSCSKSILLNHVMTDQTHPSFWNRECPFSQIERQLADGLVECQWFIPSCKRDDAFKDVTMFMNLRGDACKFKKQFNVMKYFANIIVCMVEIYDIGVPDILDFMKDLHASPVKIVLVLTSKEPESMTTDLLKRQLEPYTKIFGKNDSVILGFEIESKRPKLIVDIKHDVRKVLNKILRNETGKVIEDICYQKKMNGIVIDEDDELCKSAKKLAKEVIGCMKSYLPHEYKNNILQQEIMQELSKLQKEKERSGGNSEECNCINERACTEEKILVMRKKQLGHSLPSKLMQTFITNLTKTVDTPTVVLFVQWLKLYLDEQSRKTLPGLRSEYQAKWAKLNDAKVEGQSEIPKHKVELQKAEKKLADGSFGLEHLLRQMSQIYEAVVASNKLKKYSFIAQLPIVAAKLLINGQPIEIMDGDTASVPITWIKDLFNSLEKLIGDKRLYVISVLGVQSSGKSTLLNTIFGLQFASSAGRCTRGAFMQLIDVTDDTMNYDYVLVVDTEGLRAPELGHSKLSHDNELATFVVGLGDVTIINIKGESMEDISDVLQITVHAFVRMRLVNRNKNFQLKRSCVFIHQNVSAVDAKDKMQQGCQKVQEKLDQLTEAVCNIENINTCNINSFNNVISFDRKKHIWYFSDLWHGEPPMAPINPGYSAKAQDVKHCLLNDIPNNLSVLRLTDLVQRIEDIWRGVLSDDFVFSFRNSLAASAYHILGGKYNELKWNTEFAITEWLQTNAVTQLQGCILCDSLKELSLELKKELEKLVGDLKKTAMEKLKRFFDTHSLSDFLIEWKSQTLVRLARDTEEYRLRAEKEIHQTVDVLTNDKMTKKTQKAEIFQKAKTLAESKKGTKVDSKQLIDMFDSAWPKWMDELTINKNDEPDIEAMVEKMLIKNIIQKDLPALRKEIKEYPLTQPFESEELAGSIPSSAIELEHHLSVSESFTFYVKAVKKRPKTMHEINKIVRTAAVNTIDEIFRSVEVHLDDLSKVRSRFQESYALHVLKIVIEGHNSVKEESFTLLPALKVKLAVHASRFGIAVFKKMQADYDEKRNNELDKYKKNIFNFFKNVVKQTTNELDAADLVYNYLVEAINKVLYTTISLEIVKEITKHFGFTKYNLIVEILDDLAVNDNFFNFNRYIKNAKDFSLQWLTNFINNRFFVTLCTNGKSQFITILEGLADGIILDLKQSIKSASEKEKSKDKKYQSINTWCNNFQSFVTKIKIPDINTIVMEQDVKHFRSLERFLIKKLDAECMKEDVMNTFRNMSPEKMKWLDNTPYSLSIEKLWGCNTQCPFCNEPCVAEHTAATMQHRCIQHRPKGIRGIKWKGKGNDPNDRKLRVESCNFSVQCKDVMFNCEASRFQCRDSGKCNTTGTSVIFHKYSEYKTYLPSWDIEPSINMDSSKYWMWFIAKYKQQLSEHHNAKLPDIPNAWNNITTQQAKDSLRIYLTN